MFERLAVPKTVLIQNTVLIQIKPLPRQALAISFRRIISTLS